MIFKPEDLCTFITCSQFNSDIVINKGDSCLGVMVVSSGTVYADGVIGALGANSLVLFCDDLKVAVSGKAHFIVAQLAGAAAQKAAQSINKMLVSDCKFCPMTAEILACVLDLQVSDMQKAKLGFELLCEISHANENVGKYPPLVIEAIAEMHKNYAGLYGVEELSAELGVTKSHLVRVFSQSVGVPPGQYLTQVRVDAAKLLLSSRNYGLELIATLCGFSGSNYFCKVFKSQTGQTPAAYRKNAVGGGGVKINVTDLESSLFV